MEPGVKPPREPLPRHVKTVVAVPPPILHRPPPPAPLPTTPPELSFHDLLRSLAEAHERELAVVRAGAAGLRKPGASQSSPDAEHRGSAVGGVEDLHASRMRVHSWAVNFQEDHAEEHRKSMKGAEAAFHPGQPEATNNLGLDAPQEAIQANGKAQGSAHWAAQPIHSSNSLGSNDHPHSDQALRQLGGMVAGQARRPGSQIMKAHHELISEDLAIKSGFDAAAKAGDSAALVAACFKVWALRVAHLRTTFAFSALAPWQRQRNEPSSASDTVTSLAKWSKAFSLNHVREFGEGASQDLADDFQSSTKQSCDGRLVLAPGSSKRGWWDLVGTAMLIYDIITVPLNAFEPEPDHFTTSMDKVVLSFWTADMFVSCISGYVHHGVAIMDPGLILRNYLRTWFLLDLVVVVPDWVLAFIMPDAASAGGSRLMRIVRIMRLARLLRLMKLSRIIAMVRDRIESEVMFILARVAKMITMLLVLNHFLGSLWYLVGKLCSNGGHASWIKRKTLQNADLGYLYSTSLHWSLTQFTPASMEVHAENVFERVYTIIVMVSGLVLFSSFVSSITHSMTMLTNMSEDKNNQFWLLRRYLRQRGISHKLTFRILRCVEYAIEEKSEAVPESKVWCLGLLSPQLREELKHEASFKCLMSHPFFARARMVSSMSSLQLATQALSMEIMASNDTLFYPGTLAARMFIVALGQLTYFKLDGASWDSYSYDDQVMSKDDWACEQALWTRWTHLGALQAVSEVRLISIDVNAFGDVITRDPLAFNLARSYATKFVKWLNKQTRRELTDVSMQRHMCRTVDSMLSYDRGTSWTQALRRLGTSKT